MFFLRQLERTILLHPSFLGPHVREYLNNKLMADVEGTNTGDYYIICIVDMFDVSEGRVVPGSGSAEYTIHYRAVVWRPFKGETLDGVVSQVKEHGIFVEIGPLTAFVSAQVSMMHHSYRFDGNATPQQWVASTEDQVTVIEKDTHIRVKIAGIRGEVGQMFALASLKHDYLGPLYLDP